MALDVQNRRDFGIHRNFRRDIRRYHMAITLNTTYTGHRMTVHKNMGICNPLQKATATSTLMRTFNKSTTAVTATLASL